MQTPTIRDMFLATMAPLLLVAALATKAMACPFCDGGPSWVNEVREGIFNANFWPTVAATLLGIGMGGFVDGIVSHQILQLHDMLSASGYYPTTGVDDPQQLVVNMEINMFWDGLFHALTWTMTAAGLTILWRAGQRSDVPWSNRTMIGGLALGWGLFNLVEGVINHHIHHVIETENHLIWDIVFLASGVLLIGVGWALIQAGSGDKQTRRQNWADRGSAFMPCFQTPHGAGNPTEETQWRIQRWLLRRCSPKAWPICRT